MYFLKELNNLACPNCNKIGTINSVKGSNFIKKEYICSYCGRGWYKDYLLEIMDVQKNT